MEREKALIFYYDEKKIGVLRYSMFFHEIYSLLLSPKGVIPKAIVMAPHNYDDLKKYPKWWIENGIPDTAKIVHIWPQRNF